MPVYASNPDFIFAGTYPVPRFACGAFVSCLKHLYSELTGSELKVTQYGKPFPVTFDYAKATLSSWAEAQYGASVDRVYMVGDNPAADIRGANRAGMCFE